MGPQINHHHPHAHYHCHCSDHPPFKFENDQTNFLEKAHPETDCKVCRNHHLEDTNKKESAYNNHISRIGHYQAQREPSKGFKGFLERIFKSPIFIGLVNFSTLIANSVFALFGIVWSILGIQAIMS